MVYILGHLGLVMAYKGIVWRHVTKQLASQWYEKFNLVMEVIQGKKEQDEC